MKEMNVKNLIFQEVWSTASDKARHKTQDFVEETN
jgi:hypothetical protein